MKSSVRQESKLPDRLRTIANIFSIARIVGAPIVASCVAFSDRRRGWGTAGVVAGLALTDKIDGTLARKASGLDGQKSTKTGKWLDQMADKVMTHALTTGTAIRAFRDGRPAFGALLAANGAVQLGRDVVVTQARRRAEGQGVSTAAQTLGKIKATSLFAAGIAAVSPLVESGPHQSAGEVAVGTAMTAGTVLSVASGISLIHSMRAETEHHAEEPQTELSEATKFDD